ncbi:hypothetical protein, partial [Paenibacillus alvei]|uniref:hypothetical protein n=1 Tax=Paenibacillus alvei TaxID=44250 RepID=UPI0019D5D8EF
FAEVGNNEAKRSSSGRNITPNSTFFESNYPLQVVKTYLWDSPICCTDCYTILYHVDWLNGNNGVDNNHWNCCIPCLEAEGIRVYNKVE